MRVEKKRELCLFQEKHSFFFLFFKYFVGSPVRARLTRAVCSVGGDWRARPQHRAGKNEFRVLRIWLRRFWDSGSKWKRENSGRQIIT